MSNWEKKAIEFFATKTNRETGMVYRIPLKSVSREQLEKRIARWNAEPNCRWTYKVL